MLCGDAPGFHGIDHDCHGHPPRGDETFDVSTGSVEELKLDPGKLASNHARQWHSEHACGAGGHTNTNPTLRVLRILQE
ncbi:hypothetical protein D3C81_1829030 [compost metagenome]